VKNTGTLKFLIPANMQENLREFSKKTISAVKTALAKVPGGIVPVIMLLSVGIIALTQESPFQVNDFTGDNEEELEQEQEVFFIYESPREIPEWVKPARWFRSNSGGMPLEEMQSRIAAMRGEYALVIDFTSSLDIPEYLQDFYDNRYFIEIRTLFKNGKEDRTQWLFRDENYGVRLIAVLFEASQAASQATAQEAAQEAVQTADDKEDEPATVVEDAIASGKNAAGEETAAIQNTDGENIEIAEAQDDTEDEKPEEKVKVKKIRKPDPGSGFIEIYDEKYHITTEYRYTDKGEKSKIEYFYNGNMKISAQASVWDDDEDDYIQTHIDYYLYNRSSFLRAVERVFLRDQQITIADNVIADNGVINNDVTDNAVADSSVTNDGVTDNAVADSSVTNDDVTDNAVADSSVTNDGVTDNVVADSSVINDGVTDKAATDKGVADNVVSDSGVTKNVVRVSFPQNILAAARNDLFMGERFNSYPDFFGDLLVQKGSRLVFTTDNRGKVLDQTLIGNDEERTVIWKIVNTWSNDRIVKITKTEGEAVFLAEYVYNREGDRVLERNIKDGVLERVVRTDGKKDIEELYVDNKVVLQAVWEDGRKISESRINKN
jgi:hypothetical protein